MSFESDTVLRSLAKENNECVLVCEGEVWQLKCEARECLGLRVHFIILQLRSNIFRTWHPMAAIERQLCTYCIGLVLLAKGESEDLEMEEVNEMALDWQIS
jgi:hypothetical protein